MPHVNGWKEVQPVCVNTSVPMKCTAMGASGPYSWPCVKDVPLHMQGFECNVKFTCGESPEVVHLSHAS